MTKNKFRKHSKQQPLRGEMFKTLGKEEEPYMEGLCILWRPW